jgi:hypothetical protein
MEIKYPKGFHDKNGNTKLAIKFPDDFFKEVMKIAKKEKKTFNDMLIELAKLGKFDLDESDRHEPKRGRY